MQLAAAMDAELETDDGLGDHCAICYQRGFLLCCDGCSAVYHLACVQLTEVPEGEWLCPTCAERPKGDSAVSSHAEMVAALAATQASIPVLSPAAAPAAALSAVPPAALAAPTAVTKLEDQSVPAPATASTSTPAPAATHTSIFPSGVAAASLQATSPAPGAHSTKGQPDPTRGDAPKGPSMDHAVVGHASRLADALQLQDDANRLASSTAHLSAALADELELHDDTNGPASLMTLASTTPSTEGPFTCSAPLASSMNTGGPFTNSATTNSSMNTGGPLTNSATTNSSMNTEGPFTNSATATSSICGCAKPYMSTSTSPMASPHTFVYTYYVPPSWAQSHVTPR